MQGPRAQIDRDLYKHHLQSELAQINHLTVTEAAVEDLAIEGTSVRLVLVCLFCS